MTEQNRTGSVTDTPMHKKLWDTTAGGPIRPPAATCVRGRLQAPAHQGTDTHRRAAYEISSRWPTISSIFFPSFPYVCSVNVIHLAHKSTLCGHSRAGPLSFVNKPHVIAKTPFCSGTGARLKPRFHAGRAPAYLWGAGVW